MGCGQSASKQDSNNKSGGTKGKAAEKKDSGTTLSTTKDLQLVDPVALTKRKSRGLLYCRKGTWKRNIFDRKRSNA